jgi:RNA polymerase sigma-70 factor (ECF subfamily)
MAETRSIEKLFRRWRDEQDSDALAQVLEAAERELLPHARRQARDEATAQDLLQDTFLTAIHQARRWDDTQRLVPWLVGLLTVHAMRERRRGARTPDPERLPEREHDRPEERAAGGKVQHAVAHALEKVPQLYRDVLRLHLFEERSHAEIAAALGREPGTVRVQVFRGLEQLRRALPHGLSLGVAIAALAPHSEAA